MVLGTVLKADGPVMSRLGFDSAILPPNNRVVLHAGHDTVSKTVESGNRLGFDSSATLQYRCEE